MGGRPRLDGLAGILFEGDHLEVSQSLSINWMYPKFKLSTLTLNFHSSKTDKMNHTNKKTQLQKLLVLCYDVVSDIVQNAVATC